MNWQQRLKIDRKALLLRLELKFRGTDASMIERANQQGLTGASPPVLWQHHSFTKKMIGMLAPAQLKRSIANYLTFQTIQRPCLAPFVRIIFGIVSNLKNIHGRIQFGLFQPFLEVRGIHRLNTISLRGNLLYMCKGRNISLPVVAYTHNVLSPCKEIFVTFTISYVLRRVHAILFPALASILINRIYLKHIKYLEALVRRLQQVNSKNKRWTYCT